MQYYIYKKEKLIALPRQNFKTGIHLFLAALILSTAAAVLQVIPQLYCLIAAACCALLVAVCSFIHNRYSSLFKKKVVIEVGQDSIQYFSEEKNEMVEIAAEDIVKISTRFCELQVYTRDNTLHRINMESVKKEQARWEIKEMVKQLAGINSFTAVN